jgi:type IV pilus assembly protein PilX
MKKNPNARSRQSGIAMVVALMMLLVLTIIGTAAARMTLMEERMTGNTQDRGIAFQAAEAALRDGEAFLQSPVLPDFEGDEGLYQPADPDEDPLWRTVDWDDDDEVRVYDGLEDAPGALAEAESRYFIEQLPRVPTPGEDLSADSPVDEASFFRVTARGTGVSGNAIATLQTTYKR